MAKTNYNLDSILSGEFYTIPHEPVSDFTYTYNDSITVTTGNDVYTDILNDITITVDDSITVGKYKLTEEKIEKLIGLLDIFEDNKDLKDLLNTQIALNRIKNET